MEGPGGQAGRNRSSDQRVCSVVVPYIPSLVENHARPFKCERCLMAVTIDDDAWYVVLGTEVERNARSDSILMQIWLICYSRASDPSGSRCSG